jgi:phosphotransacetylase
MTYAFTHDGFELSHANGLMPLLRYVRPPHPLRIAVVYPCNEVSLSAAIDAQTAGLIEPVLIGPADRLLSISEEFGIDLEHVTIEDVQRSDEAAAYALELAFKGNVEAVMQGSLSTEELLRAGVILGARVPVVLASRPDTREARIASCALALLAARRPPQRPFTPIAAFEEAAWFPV